MTHHSSPVRARYGVSFVSSTSDKILSQSLYHSTLQWRHNERDGVSNHRPHDCLLTRLFRRRLKETSKPCVTGLCGGNSPVTDEFPAQGASNAENVSIWWRHHDTVYCHTGPCYNGAWLYMVRSVYVAMMMHWACTSRNQWTVWADRRPNGHVRIYVCSAHQVMAHGWNLRVMGIWNAFILFCNLHLERKLVL